MWGFITWWFHYCMQGNIEIGWMDGAGRGLIHFRQFEIGDEALIKAAVEANSVPGQSLYVRASTVRPNNLGRTSDVDFVQAPGIWGDLDTAEQVERAKGVQTMVRPNGSVITGRHPHLRVQTFFRTLGPIIQSDDVRSLNGRLHALYGGDSSVVNPTRLMRLPGTIAWPWKANRIPELTGFALPTDNRPTAYLIEMLFSQLPQEKLEAIPPIPPGSSATLNTAGALIRLIQAGDHWHDHMIRLVAHWIGRGWSNAEILAAASAFTLPGYTGTQTQAEVGKAIEGGRTKWGVPDEEKPIGADPANPFADQVVDPWDTLTPPVFPIHALPDALQRFVESRARIMGADPCALAWSALSACSAALHGTIRMQIKKHDNWAVPPSIWVALVGRSSSKKTPIISAAWGPLERAQASDLKEFAAEMQRWRALDKAEKAQTPQPVPRRRLLTHDATMEGLQEILCNQSRGIGVLRDELAGFIGSLDKYSGGRGGAADRAFFLQGYNGGPHVVDRIGRGTTALENLLLTICGGIQPDRLAQFTDLTDDGLWQRFLPIIVADATMGVDEGSGPETEGYADILEQLLAVPAQTRASFSDAGHVVRKRVEEEFYKLERGEPLGGKFASFCGKMPGLFGRLCLVLGQFDRDGLGYIISEKTADAARVLITNCVLPHAARVYLTMGATSGGSIETTRLIAGFILVKRTSRLLASDLTRKVRVCRNASLSEVQKMVSPLVAGGWLTPEKEHGGNNAWLVNPRAHDIFLSRADAEIKRRSAFRELLTGDEDDGE